MYLYKKLAIQFEKQNKKCLVVESCYTANKIIIATTNASNAIDSNKANDNIPVDIKSLLADGFLEIDSTNEENKRPKPSPTPNNGNTASPAANNFTAATSIYTSLFDMFSRDSDR